MSACLTLVGCVYLIIDHHWCWHEFETIQYAAINFDGVITPHPAFFGCPGAVEHRHFGIPGWRF
jgi:hypothetical protein